MENITNPILESWSFAHDKGPYDAPEYTRIVIVAKVYNHKDFADGSRIKTSELVNYDFDQGLVYTKGGTYELGRPDAEWLVWLNKTNQTKEINKFMNKFYNSVN